MAVAQAALGKPPACIPGKYLPVSESVSERNDGAGLDGGVMEEVDCRRYGISLGSGPVERNRKSLGKERGRHIA